MRNYSKFILSRVQSNKLNIMSFIISVFLFLPSICEAQNLLNKPQKIIIDEARNRYLVSNFIQGGDLVQIDEQGNQSYFIENAGLIDALEIIGDTIYGTSIGGNVKGYDLNSGTLVMDMDFTVDGVQVLTGLVADSLGFIYGSERFGNRIFKIDPISQTHWVYAEGNGIDQPNGLLYEKEKNRILICLDKPNPPILALNLSDSTITIATTTTLLGSDGIARDKKGNYYITGYELPGIYKFDSNFQQVEGLLYKETTVIYPVYNEVNNSLLVTLYKQNEWKEILLDNITSIAISGESNDTTIEEKEGTLQLFAYVLPKDAEDTTITWSVEDGTATASISESGLLQATGTVEGNGTVTVKATANDASGTITTKIITISNQLINGVELTTSNFSIYPNPAKNVVNICNNNLIVNNCVIEIININGQVILEKQFQTIGMKETIDLEGIKKGVYFIKIQNSNLVTIKKLIVE